LMIYYLSCVTTFKIKRKEFGHINLPYFDAIVTVVGEPTCPA
jgi:hypothetical protein